MDPTHIIWSKLIPQYMPAVGLGTPMRCLTIFKIIKSSDETNWPIDTLCTGFGGVAEYAMLPFAACNKVIPGIPLTWNLGPFSLLQGHTAWIGYKICNP
jgi:NADPH-dependent curcumin reductase CurA